jgi:hypothetical protein
MGKIIWRELTIAYTVWLLLLLILDLLMHQFVGLVLPLAGLEIIWVVNFFVMLWTKRP